jgi:hypothetical protein
MSLLDGDLGGLGDILGGDGGGGSDPGQGGDWDMANGTGGESGGDGGGLLSQLTGGTAGGGGDGSPSFGSILGAIEGVSSAIGSGLGGGATNAAKKNMPGLMTAAMQTPQVMTALWVGGLFVVVVLAGLSYAIWGRT